MGLRHFRLGFGWQSQTSLSVSVQSLSSKRRDLSVRFSRGAYTARSVAAMIRKCGIIDNPTPERINKSFKLYRRNGSQNSPDKPHIMVERKRFFPRFATSVKDADWRGSGAIVKIAYVGGFDTVGAVGMPPSLPGPLAMAWHSKYKFHHMALPA